MVYKLTLKLVGVTLNYNAMYYAVTPKDSNLLVLAHDTIIDMYGIVLRDEAYVPLVKQAMFWRIFCIVTEADGAENDLILEGKPDSDLRMTIWIAF